MKKKKIEDDTLKRIESLAKRADENKGFELGLETEFSKEEVLKLDFVDNKQNPDESYKLYYAIEGILKSNLPTGPENEKIRTFVREEKIIFLTGGKKKDKNGLRGADSRQAYISSHLEVALNTLIEWLQEGTGTYDLFLKFRNLNIQYGYFEKDELDKFNQSKE
jgi:hypothetical protein